MIWKNFLLENYKENKENKKNNRLIYWEEHLLWMKYKKNDEKCNLI